MINDLFKQIESQMSHRLSEVRLKFNNSTNKGGTLEDVFREFVSEYLPRSYSIGHGEIIDSHGSQSPQMDIVIAHDYHPFTFSRESPGIFLIEGVAAIGEVKTCLTSAELSKSIAASKKTKSLRRHITPKTQIRIPHGFDGRYIATPPYFLFAYESQLTLKTIAENLGKEVHCAKDTEGTRFIDAVFVLGRGAIINFWPGAMLQALDKNGNPLKGFVYFENGDAIKPLMDWLYASLLRIDYSRPILWSYTGMQVEDEK